MQFINYTVCFVLLSLVLLSNGAQAYPRRAEWMSGKWGIGYRIPYTLLDWYDVDAFVDQITSLQKKPDYVIVNLSGAAHGGDVYLAYSDMLYSAGNVNSSPLPNERQLFDELLDQIKAEGIKVIAYCAGQGPALLKAGVTKAFDYDAATGESQAYNNWEQYVQDEYAALGTNVTEEDFQEAYADLIFEFAYHYGDDLDGWWFDQGHLMNRELVELNIHLANPDAVIAFNLGAPYELSVKDPWVEDYTAGHPNPVKLTEPSDYANFPMIESVTQSYDGFVLSADGSNAESLGHVFMPMAKNSWNGVGDQFENAWTESQAVDWMTQVVEGGGAWTWNLPRASNNDPDRFSLLREDWMDFLDTVTFQLPLLCGDEHMCDGPEYKTVCRVLDTGNQFEVCAKETWPWAHGGSNHNYCGDCVGGLCLNNPKESDPCDDHATCTFRIPGSDSQNCPWLREQDPDIIEALCQSSETREICPETCQVCADNCEDTEGVTFLIAGVEQTCEYLESHPELYDDVCEGQAWDICFETCGNCDGEYIDLNPILDCSDSQYDCNDESGDYSSVCIVRDTLNQYPTCAHKDWAWIFNKPNNLNYCGECQGGWCYDTPVATDPCDDSHYCEFTTSRTPTRTAEKCIWLRAQDGDSIDFFCSRRDAQEICPETCGICSDNCEDDESEGVIVIDGVANNCGYLEARPELHAEVCAQADAWDACKETCGNCGGEYIDP